MVYTEMKSPEYYLNFARKYQKSQLEVLNYFQQKKLAEAGMLDDYLKMIDIKRQATERIQEEKESRETKPLLRNKNVVFEEMKIAEPVENESEYQRTIIKSSRPRNAGDKYSFYVDDKLELELNLDKTGTLESYKKFVKLLLIDELYFGGVDKKNEFIKAINKNNYKIPRSPARPPTYLPTEIRESTDSPLKKRQIKPTGVEIETTIGMGHYNKDLHELNMLVSARMAGNGNKKMLIDIKKLIKKLIKNKILTKKQEQAILKKV